MAYNLTALLLFTAALLLFAFESPSTHVAADTLNGLTVNGRLCCTANGNCPGQSLAGVGVRLNCTLLGLTTTIIGFGTTDSNGAYTITVPALPGLALGSPLLPCTVNVRLPLEAAVCPVLSTTTGLLVGTLRAVGMVVNAVLGPVQVATVDAYVRLGV